MRTIDTDPDNGGERGDLQRLVEAFQNDTPGDRERLEETILNAEPASFQYLTDPWTSRGVMKRPSIGSSGLFVVGACVLDILPYDVDVACSFMESSRPIEA